MNRVCERMVKFTGDQVVFRIWVTADQNFRVDLSELNKLLDSLKKTEASENSIQKAICEIEKLDNIAAIEILTKEGDGILLYPNWN